MTNFDLKRLNAGSAAALHEVNACLATLTAEERVRWALEQAQHDVQQQEPLEPGQTPDH